MNGWQRIWLVLTCLGLLGAVVFAWIHANKSMGAWEHVASLKRDLANPKCASFTTEPLLDSLAEPQIGNCYEIHTFRRVVTPRAPYTLEVFRKNQDARKRQTFWWNARVLVFLTVLCSVLLYLAGIIVAWIRRGFSPQ